MKRVGFFCFEEKNNDCRRQRMMKVLIVIIDVYKRQGEGRTVMRGLLMKDLELIKINMKMYLAVFLIGIIYLVAQENGSTFFVAYAIFVSIGVSVGTISYDGYHHGMKFLMTLPVTKKQYVQSKYLLSFGFAVLVSVISRCV